MLSPRLRQEVFKLWTKFWSSGITNPLVAVEQITYLLFLRHLEQLDNDRVRSGKPSIFTGEGEQCSWRVIKQTPTFELFTKTVFPWLRTLDTKVFATAIDGDAGTERIMEDAYFQLPEEKASY